MTYNKFIKFVKQSGIFYIPCYALLKLDNMKYVKCRDKFSNEVKDNTVSVTFPDVVVPFNYNEGITEGITSLIIAVCIGRLKQMPHNNCIR